MKRISSHCRGYDSEDDGKDWRRSLKEGWSGFGRSDVIFFLRKEELPKLLGIEKKEKAACMWTDLFWP